MVAFKHFVKHDFSDGQLGLRAPAVDLKEIVENLVFNLDLCFFEGFGEFWAFSFDLTGERAFHFCSGSGSFIFGSIQIGFRVHV